MPKTILIADDEQGVRSSLERLLEFESYRVVQAADGPSALDLVRDRPVDLVLLDIKMPGMDGLEVLAQLHQEHPQLPVVIISGHGTIQTAVEATRLGAFDFIEKPIDADRILLVIRNGLAQRRLLRENVSLKAEVRQRARVVGQHPEMLRILETVKKVAPANVRVLIMGENGTGKEMIARALHAHSSRATGPWVAVNCAAIPETLLESELFGYVRGAFTDARKDRPGLFHEANGGTLFLDEIGEIPVTLQAKLLRAIEDREIRPLGSNKSEKVDVRLVSASNRDLEQCVEEGRFRRDLYYRLNVIRLDLPALRERADDIPLLVNYFIEKFASQAQHRITGIDNDALALLVNYRWPGNVRELEHTIERMVLLGKHSTIAVDDLPPQLLANNQSKLPLAEAVARGYTLANLEREYIEQVLENVNGNKSEAAKVLSVDRTTLYRKLEEYKLKA